MKHGQKVRIKGTDIAGTYSGLSVAHDDARIVRAVDGSFAVPAELVEPIVESVKVEFDPVEMPLKVPTWYGEFEFFPAPGGRQYLTVGFIDHDGGAGISGKNINYAEARKLAFAILTITEKSDD